MGGIHAHRWSQSIIPLSISCAGCCSNRGMHISPRCLFSIIVALRCSALFCAAQRAHTLFPDIVRRYRKKNWGDAGSNPASQSYFTQCRNESGGRVTTPLHRRKTPAIVFRLLMALIRTFHPIFPTHPIRTICEQKWGLCVDMLI